MSLRKSSVAVATAPLPVNNGLPLAKLRALVTDTLEDHKAQDIVLIPLAGRASFADYLIIATGTSSRHISSMADKLDEQLRGNGHPIIGMEGQKEGEWVVVDAGDVVIHLFQAAQRQLYNLEKLWSFPPEK